MRIELRAEVPEDTRAVGEILADLLEPGDAVALTGELGAGKTTFVQGVARGLGFTGAVTSPTFTLVREYPARLHVHHVDVYRLERVQDALDLGLEEMTAEGGVLLVEWGDAIETLLPDEHLVIELTVPDETEGRLLVLTGVGASWAARWGQLEESTASWRTAA
jgi:tRNA threonylcarbamoyladenosine biosynthesis protein TsaE